MKSKYKHIFEPFTIKHMTVKNRIVMTPMGTNYGEQNGEMSFLHINYYEQRAKGGTGLDVYKRQGYDRYSGLGGFTRNFYKEKKLKVNIVCECPDENAIAALVAEDFGIALVARVDAVDQANVTVLPLADADLTHTVYMGYIRDKYQIPAVKRFIQFVKRDGKAY